MIRNEDGVLISELSANQVPAKGEKRQVIVYNPGPERIASKAYDLEF